MSVGLIRLIKADLSQRFFSPAPSLRAHPDESAAASICFGFATIDRNNTNARNFCQNRLGPTVTC